MIFPEDANRFLKFLVQFVYLSTEIKAKLLKHFKTTSQSFKVCLYIIPDLHTK